MHVALQRVLSILAYPKHHSGSEDLAPLLLSNSMLIEAWRADSINQVGNSHCAVSLLTSAHAPNEPVRTLLHRTRFTSASGPISNPWIPNVA